MIPTGFMWVCIEDGDDSGSRFDAATLPRRGSGSALERRRLEEGDQPSLAQFVSQDGRPAGDAA